MKKNHYKMGLMISNRLGFYEEGWKDPSSLIILEFAFGQKDLLETV